MIYAAIVLAALLVAWLWPRLQAVVVFEYERGLRYERGRFRELAGPGSYWIFRPHTVIHKVDIRPTTIVIPGQEVVTSDGVGLKISVSAVYRVADAVKAVKDLMFPGDLKKVFSQVVRARQEGLAALEKARGEAAALRSLANSAALLESKPALFQLRLLQAIGQDSGNTVVVNFGTSELVSKGSSHTGKTPLATEQEQ